MKFSEYKYIRPDIDDWKARFQKLLEEFKLSPTAEDQVRSLEKIYSMRSEFETMREIASIRHTIDTKDEQYEKEHDFFDKYDPIYEGLVTDFYRLLIGSRFRADLEDRYGKQLFRIAELSIRTFKPEIIEDLQLENKLSSEYTKLKASASINYKGEERNLSGMLPFMRSDDRKIREESSLLYWGFMEENEDQFDRIYDQLVKVRHRIAQKLGYENFVPLGYDRMLRSDYDSSMVSQFRDQVYDHIVPIAEKLRKQQADRLDIDKLKYFDEDVLFKDGNPSPHGDADWILARGKEMYDDLSSETSEFFNYMTNSELMDLVTKNGKASGGYCTYINKYKAPFIFSNFNGTAGDIFVLTHEAGHAFQVYMSRGFDLNEYNWPTFEACEIHSMSMEFFTWPWMDKFFNGEADKFRYLHLIKALLFLPYGVAVDEFQHRIYENPEHSPEQRKATWRSIERKYLPYRDYSDNTYLEKGAYWHIQSHVFQSPFYYIDYTLAQICAFQFWKKAQTDRDVAFADYLKLCKAGGSKPFLDLVQYANLRSPFEDGSIEDVTEEIENWLLAYKDSPFLLTEN